MPKFLKIQNLLSLTICCLIWIGGFLSSKTIASPNNLDRQIEIELEEVPGAKQYEVKITSLTHSAIPAKVFNLKKAFFSERLPLGSWKIEVRSYDRRGIPGRWQLIGDVNIGFKPPTLLTPSRDEKIISTKGKKTIISFKWDSFNPSASYTLTITNTSENKTVLQKSITGTSFDIKLPSSTYSWALKSEVPHGTTLDGIDPEPQNFEILSRKLSEVIVNKFERLPPKIVSWKAVENAEEYEVLLVQVKESNSTEVDPPKVIFKKTTSDLSHIIPAALSPGFYRISITARSKSIEDSKPSSENFQILAPVVTSDKSQPPAKPPPEVAKKNTEEVAKKAIPDRHVLVDYVQGSIGPTFWKYSFDAQEGQSFSLFALSLTAISSDATKWFAKSKESAWAFEIRGRQTNIFLFDPPSEEAPKQSKVTVADRRIATILRRRSIFDRVGADIIIGFGTHYYTYLLQSGSDSIIEPVYGNLLEYYIGGAIDWQLRNGNHAGFDLTFHPVSSSIGISAIKSLQYTATLRYIKNIFHERSNLTLNLENITSKVTITSEKFSGGATTTNTWYRGGIGLAIKI